MYVKADSKSDTEFFQLVAQLVKKCANIQGQINRKLHFHTGLISSLLCPSRMETGDRERVCERERDRVGKQKKNL